MKKLLTLVSLFILVLTGCGTSNSSNSSITIQGSTSVEEFVKGVIAPAYEKETNKKIEYQANGSSAGIKAAQDGVSTFGTSSRSLTEDEVASGLKQEELAVDGIALVVNPKNEVKDLTSKQIIDIYTGKITNWQEVGGKDEQIQVVSREEGSGTRSAFEELLSIENQVDESATISDGNGNVANTVASNENAIGYISFETMYANKDKVSAIKLDGVEPSAKTVQSADYKLSRPFILVYKEENLSDDDREFIDYLQKNKASLAPEAGLIESNK